MRILVTGGSGFIGSRLIPALLERGHEVTNLDLVRSSAEGALTVIGDVCDVDALTAIAADHDAIVHLAAEHRDDVSPVSRYTEVNVGGSAAVIAAAEANGIERIVFTSTVAVYGLDNSDAGEDSEPRPFNEYGRTKLQAERLFLDWAKAEPERSLTVVRPSVVFGEGNRGNVYTLARQVHARRFLMVGDGSNRKSMAYVGNIVEYLADALTAPAGITVINYADKPDLSTRELLAVLRAAMGIRHGGALRLPLWLGLAGGYAIDGVAKVSRRTFPISAVRIRKFVADTTVNTERLDATGYRPKHSLAEAIARTIDAEFPASERARS